MKIISLYGNENHLIKKSIKGDGQAQKQLYERFAPKMLSVCRQYIKDLQFSEDVMIDGFVKVFNNLGSFEGKGSFEGWIRTTMVRECISFLRRKQFVVYDSEVYESQKYEADKNLLAFDVEYVQRLIDGLPEGYRMVFLLYAVEGYKHHEIAEMLEISIGTSKSQLYKAKKMLQENLTLHGVVPSAKSSNQK
ncbi:MAG: RNA polymerase sigma factor [Allomuricauda sp.]